MLPSTSLPSCADVLLGDAQLHGFGAAVELDRFGHPPDALGRRAGDGKNRRRLAFGFVDLPLPLRLGRLDRLLLVALGGVDDGVAMTPSDVRMTARFSRSARICFSIAASTSCGGVMLFTS